MKKIIALTLLIITVLTTSVFAETNDVQNQSGEQILLSKEESGSFNNTIADMSPDINMVIESYNKRQKNGRGLIDRDSKDVKAKENIKIYAFADILSSDFYKTYEEKGDLDEFIAKQNAIITVYRDSEEQFIDSILFIKDPQSDEKTIDGWASVSSGTFIMAEDTIHFLSDEKNIKDLLDSLSIKNPKDLKVIVGIQGVNAALYLKENGQPIIIPLSDGDTYDENVATCKAFTPYLASDFFKARKTSALEIEKKFQEEALKPAVERNLCSSGAINYENLNPVNLSAINTTEINKTSEHNYYPLIVCSFLVLGGISLGILYKKKIIKL
ncbi:hypothetical protein [Clostridium ihumii]|uniref:hypothetical protein n=1 Tax=Clostridium ihumii TaxID=1470356 RepID=UPI00058B4FD1|nr:hypothetical protein [Clostridium ihumii]